MASISAPRAWLPPPSSGARLAVAPLATAPPGSGGGVLLHGISTGSPLLDAGAPAAIAAALAGVLTLGRDAASRRRRRQTLRRGSRRCCSTTARHALGTEAKADNYVALLIEKPDGQVLQVEAKPSETIRALKAIIQVDLGIAEKQQELAFNDLSLQDEFKLVECGIVEGSKLCLTIKEVVIASTDDQADPVAEGDIRVKVRAGTLDNDDEGITLDIARTASVKDLKSLAYKELSEDNEFLARLPVTDYGLFILKNNMPLTDGKTFRYLTREEKVKELVTVEEAGLKNGEDIVFASLFFYSG